MCIEQGGERTCVKAAPVGGGEQADASTLSETGSFTVLHDRLGKAMIALE